MSFLADENFPRSAVEALRQRGFDVEWVAETASGVPDETVLRRCMEGRRTLLTLDKDFGELVLRNGLPAENGVILFRVDPSSPETFVEVALDDFSGS